MLMGGEPREREKGGGDWAGWVVQGYFNVFFLGFYLLCFCGVNLLWFHSLLACLRWLFIFIICIVCYQRCVYTEFSFRFLLTRGNVMS